MANEIISTKERKKKKNSDMMKIVHFYDDNVKMENVETDGSKVNKFQISVKNLMLIFNIMHKKRSYYIENTVCIRSPKLSNIESCSCLDE